MTDYLTIVRVVYGGLSQRQAVTTYHVSRNTVSLLVRHVKNQGWLTVEEKDLKLSPPGYNWPTPQT